jgi:hypothetical protein
LDYPYSAMSITARQRNQNVTPIVRLQVPSAGRFALNVPGDGQELLEKEEHAECHAERLALPNKIKTEREGHKQLQKCPPRNGGSQPEDPKEGMTTSVNLHEDVVHEAGHFHIAH